MNKYEEYADAFGTLHRDIRLIIGRYIYISPFSVKVKILPYNHPVFSMSGMQQGQVPIFVIFRTIYIARGVLNDPGVHYGYSLNLRTPHGFALLAHEVYHVYQYLRDGPKSTVKEYFTTMFLSWQKARILWDHTISKFEQEAIAFEKKVFADLERYPEILETFR